MSSQSCLTKSTNNSSNLAAFESRPKHQTRNLLSSKTQMIDMSSYNSMISSNPGSINDSKITSAVNESKISAATKELMLFDPEDIIDDNSLVAKLVKTDVMLLQKCLKSNNKKIYFAAIESIKQRSG